MSTQTIANSSARFSLRNVTAEYKLGVIHLLCLAIITLIPLNQALTTFRWQPIILLLNCVIAVGITRRLGSNNPTPNTNWRSLWALWLFVAYVIIATFIRQATFTTIWTLPPNWYSNNFLIEMTPNDILIAGGGYLLCLFLCWGAGCLRIYLQSWRVWGGLFLTGGIAYWYTQAVHVPYDIKLLILLGLLPTALFIHALLRRNTQAQLESGTLLLVVFSLYNKPFLMVPTYLVIGIGAYIASTRLSRKWLTTVVVGVLIAATSIAIQYIYIFINTVKAQVVQLSPGPMGWRWIRLFRVSGFFPVIFPAITAMLALQCQRWYWRVFLVILLLLQLVHVLITGYRMLWVALFFQVLLIIYAYLRPRLRPYFGSAILLLFLCAAAMFCSMLTKTKQAIQSSSLSTGAPIEASMYDRIHFWKAGLLIFQSSPLIGKGFGCYHDEATWWSKVLNLGYASWPFHSHNSYLDLLCGGGLIGALLILGAVIQLGTACRRIYSEIPVLRPLLVVLISLVLACAVTVSMTDTLFTTAEWIIPNIIFYALLFGQRKTENEESTTTHVLAQ